MVKELPQTLASPETPQITTAEAEAMARAVVKLFEKWEFSDGIAREVLGGLTPRTYARWKAGKPGCIDRNLATRLSLLIGIHKRLRDLFADPERGYAWMSKPNDTFGGRSAAEIIGQGDIFSLVRVRSYLDAECDGS